MRPTVTELSTAWVGVSGNVAMVFRLPARSDSRGSHRGRPHEFIGIVVRRDESGVPSSPREPSSVSGGGQRDRNRADIAGCQSTAANGRPVPRLAMYPARGSAHERTPRAEARTNAPARGSAHERNEPPRGLARAVAGPWHCRQQFEGVGRMRANTSRSTMVGATLYVRGGAVKSHKVS